MNLLELMGTVMMYVYHPRYVMQPSKTFLWEMGKTDRNQFLNSCFPDNTWVKLGRKQGYLQHVIDEFMLTDDK